MSSAIADAFVDRTPIDWTGLLARIRDPRDRGSLDALRRLDNLRGAGHAAATPAPPDARVPLLGVLIVLGALQTACGLAGAAAAFAGGRPIAQLAPQLLLAGAFAFASVMLASASVRDRRVLFLLATFTVASSAFARPVLTGLPGHWPGPASLLYRGVFPETFAPAALWQFAVLFPAVRRFTAFDVWARRAGAVAWLLAAGLFAANLAAAYGAAARPFAILGRDNPGNLFWHLFIVAALPAVAAIFVRACRSPRAERRKVVRFGCAIAAGGAPFFITGVARMALPGLDRWILTARGLGRLSIDVGIVGGLAALPILATLAVVVDRPFELHAIVPTWLRRWAAGRRVDLLEIMGTPRRQTRRERLTAALDRVRLARGSREVAAVVRRELAFGVGARSVTVLDAGALPVGTAIVAILDESSAPVILARDCEPFILLPRAEREWLEAEGVTLAAPIRFRDGTMAAVALLGARRGEGSYDRTDRWFISTLLTGAAAAWDAPEAGHEAEEAAFECERCGQVADLEPVQCGCGTSAMLASLPRRLGNKFAVTRRLGAGGMGVVYLGRDITLGRDVALKTLPSLGEGSVARLRDEARAMAALNHGSLATIYGLEVWRRTPVLVVEYFPGGTLADRLAFGPLPRGELLALGIRLADALTYMHGRGVLHRDLKPSNIGLTRDGGAKLLDFGLSAEPNMLAGTPEYLPPEALAGAPPDTGVDLWGLSMVLLRASGGRAAQADALTAFFERALASSKSERFQSSAEIRAALAALQG